MPDWFRTSVIAPGVFRAAEPFANSYFSANLYTVHGRDADLQFDFGLGLVPLRPALNLSGAPVIAVASHAHVDHVGGLHEFSHRLGHAAEAEGFASMTNPFTLKHSFTSERHGPAVSRPPHPGFDLASWDLRPAPLTAHLAEGDSVDLGNRRFAVLHLPGHSSGSIALLDEDDGLLLAGDVIYDDGLLDDIPGASIPDYLATMQRLLDLDCRLVLPGHGEVFDGDRMHELARGYIRSKE